MSKDFSTTSEAILNEKTNAVEKLVAIVNFIRPKNPQDIEEARFNMLQLANNLNTNNQLRNTLCVALHHWILNSRISTNLASIGILSKNGLLHEFLERFYNKFLPSPPIGNDFEHLFSTLFYKKSDSIWVNEIPTQTWIALFKTLLFSPEFHKKTADHLFYEILYGFEILSIWIASEEFDDNFIRFDASLLKKDSAFIALQREVSTLCQKLQDETIRILDIEGDFEHIEVLLDQCEQTLNSLRKKSISKGISLSLTHEFERFEQIIERTRKTLFLIQYYGLDEFNVAMVELFKEVITKNSARNSLGDILSTSTKILAKSITNNASEHGEHYITETKKEYLKMFFSAAGAGIIIALMALYKINITQMGFDKGFETILVCLNYGLGFVIIHLLGFTVATKQPAMTASTFAKAVEKGKNNRTNQLKLVELVFKVSRSQFAAVLGNVILALSVAAGIGYWYISNDDGFLSAQKASYYLQNSHPYPALIYAAIAGVWLFCSGVISGYFDNRADLLNLKQRYFHHPFLVKIIPSNLREKLASFFHENHGAIAGNFIFGVLLGVTPYIGYLLNFPLDIRHVAFSTANFGYSIIHEGISVGYFFLTLLFVLMIGLVNLVVSFALALFVSLRARDAVFGSFLGFLQLLIKEVRKRPKELFWPEKRDI